MTLQPNHIQALNLATRTLFDKERHKNDDDLDRGANGDRPQRTFCWHMSETQVTPLVHQETETRGDQGFATLSLVSSQIPLLWNLMMATYIAWLTRNPPNPLENHPKLGTPFTSRTQTTEHFLVVCPTNLEETHSLDHCRISCSTRRVNGNQLSHFHWA